MFLSSALIAPVFCFCVDRVTSALVSFYKKPKSFYLTEAGHSVLFQNLQHPRAISSLFRDIPVLDSDFPMSGMGPNGATLSLEDVGLDHTATPGQMIAALQARKAASEAARAATPGHKWVSGAEEIQLCQDLAPLGKYEVFLHDPVVARFLSSRLTGQKNSALTPLVSQLEVFRGETLYFKGYGTDGNCIPNFVVLPPYNPKAPDPFRKMGEKCDGGWVDSSALDLHILSHVPLGQPVTVNVALMDSRWGDDWAKATLAFGEFDLGERNGRLFTLPLLSLPIDWLLADWENCPLYLSITYNGLPKSWKDSPVMTLGEISFSEFFKTSFSPYSRLKPSMTAITAERDSSRITAGLSVVKSYEADTSRVLSTEEKDYRVWTKPNKKSLNTEKVGSSTCLLGTQPNFARCSSSLSSLRRRQPPRNSVDAWVKTQASKLHGKDDCCDSDATGCMASPSELPCASERLEVTGLSEPPQIQRLSVQRPSIDNLDGAFVHESRTTSKVQNLVEGTGLTAVSVASLFGKSSITSARLAMLACACITFRAEVTITCPVHVLGLFKAFYDVGLAFKGVTNLHCVEHLPGVLLDGVRDTKATVLVTPPVLAKSASFGENKNLGQLVVATTSTVRGEPEDTITVKTRWYVHKIDTWVDNAIGNAQSFSSDFSSGPHDLYIGDPVLKLDLDVSSPIGTQWRVPIIPGLGIRQSKLWLPNCSTALLEAHRSWTGTCIFQYYFVNPPLSRGIFHLVALPPGKYDTNKLDLDRIFSRELSQDFVSLCTIDLAENHSGFISVDFASFLGFFPCGSQGHFLKNHEFCPWVTLVQVSNLTTLTKDFKNFHFSLRLVEIKDAVLDGPCLVPATRLALPTHTLYADTADGNGLLNCPNLIYAGSLMSWPKGKHVWVSFPVSPAYHVLNGTYSTNREISLVRALPNVLVHQSQSAYLWRGGMSYTFVLTKQGTMRASYTAQPLAEFHHGILQRNSKTESPMRGSTAVAFTQNTFELSLSFTINQGKLFELFRCTNAGTTTAARTLSINGWVFVELPPWEEGQNCHIYQKTCSDFQFSGFYPPSQVVTTEDKPPSLVYN
uniref:Polyprotein P2 n=1 Tax=Alpine wild prunus virus TaxID=2995353 RepID=A0AA50KVZ1_9SECO|nr:polyprotein P2 [Alpine wild prunus virus]